MTSLELEIRSWGSRKVPGLESMQNTNPGSATHETSDFGQIFEPHFPYLQNWDCSEIHESLV